jgi:hypothetical protein
LRPEFSKRELAPGERFQNAGLFERDGFKQLRRLRPQSERKPDIALEKSRSKPVLVLGRRNDLMRPAIMPLLGNASLLTATYDKFLWI